MNVATIPKKYSGKNKAEFLVKHGDDLRNTVAIKHSKNI